MRSFHEERVVDFVFLASSRWLCDSLRQALGKGCSEVYFLYVVAIFVLAEYEEPVWLVVQAADQTHATHWVLVEVRLAEQVKEAMLLDIYDFEVCVNHRQVEPSLIRHFRVWILCFCSICVLRYNYLHFCDREACLLKGCTILSEQDLFVVWISALTLEKSESYDCEVFLSLWNVLFFLVFGSRGHNDVLIPTTPSHCYYI